MYALLVRLKVVYQIEEDDSSFFTNINYQTQASVPILLGPSFPAG